MKILPICCFLGCLFWNIGIKSTALFLRKHLELLKGSSTVKKKKKSLLQIGSLLCILCVYNRYLDFMQLNSFCTELVPVRGQADRGDL